MEIAIIAELEQYSLIHLISSTSARGLYHGEGVWGDREFFSLPSLPSLRSPFLCLPRKLRNIHLLHGTNDDLNNN